MNNISKAVLYFIAALLFVFAAVFGSAFIDKVVKKPSPDEISPSQVFESVTCPKDFAAYNSLRGESGQVATLIGDRKQMFAANGRFINTQIVVTKNETKDSKVACGYLLVRAGTNDNGALKSWENIYINPDNFGGHMDSSTQFGIGDGRNYSEYLFSLSDIQYWKTRAERGRNVLSRADWAALFNVSESVTFQIALNTEDRSGFIDEVSITYKCWNPQTGKQNSGCKLEVQKPVDTETESLM